MAADSANAGPQSTLASIAALIVRALDEQGGNGKAVLDSVGLNPALLLDPEARYPVSKMQKLWRAATAISGDPCFGLKVAQALQPSALHGLGFSWLASDTLGDALQRVVRYSRLLSTLSRVRLEEGEESCKLSIEPMVARAEIAPASVDGALALVLQMCRITAGMSLNPKRVLLARQPPACAKRLQRFFRAPIEFASNEIAICFAPSQLSVRQPFANPELARINDQVVIDYLARFDRKNIVLQVRSQIIEQLPSGSPNQEKIAAALHMSLRKLQRRLRAESTSFTHLLDDTRQQLATNYLRSSRRSVGEVSYLLGFSEPANFARAFKRWAGMTPMQYRDAQTHQA